MVCVCVGGHICTLQSLMVAKAKEDLEQEILDKEEEKQRYLAERVPPLKSSGLPFADLQVTAQTIASPSYSHYNVISYQGAKSKYCEQKAVLSEFD